MGWGGGVVGGALWRFLCVFVSREVGWCGLVFGVRMNVDFDCRGGGWSFVLWVSYLRGFGFEAANRYYPPPSSVLISVRKRVLNGGLQGALFAQLAPWPVRVQPGPLSSIDPQRDKRQRLCANMWQAFDERILPLTGTRRPSLAVPPSLGEECAYFKVAGSARRTDPLTLSAQRDHDAHRPRRRSRARFFPADSLFRTDRLDSEKKAESTRAAPHP